MSKLDLDAIEARANAATDGPWKWEGDVADNEAFLYRGTHGVVTASGMHTEGYIYISPADAEFIAHAREDVPALIAEVRRHREDLREWEEHGAPAWVAAKESAIAEVRRERDEAREETHNLSQRPSSVDVVTILAHTYGKKTRLADDMHAATAVLALFPKVGGEGD